VKLKKSVEEANSIYLADIAAIRAEVAEKPKNIVIKHGDKMHKSNVASILKIVHKQVENGWNTKMHMVLWRHGENTKT